VHLAGLHLNWARIVFPLESAWFEHANLLPELTPLRWIRWSGTASVAEHFFAVYGPGSSCGASRDHQGEPGAPGGFQWR
jgi:hypothetical protein